VTFELLDDVGPRELIRSITSPELPLVLEGIFQARPH
jgi:hypothetical protein